MMQHRNSRETVPPYDSQLGRSLIFLLYACGFPHHRIASLFDVNSGRIAETMGLLKEVEELEPSNAKVRAVS
jgi:hypothetical protein